MARLVAFATDMPTGNNEVTSIDLMRSSADAPSGIMDEVFIHLFELARTAALGISTWGWPAGECR